VTSVFFRAFDSPATLYDALREAVIDARNTTGLK
jgi:hypothetical protein